MATPKTGKPVGRPTIEFDLAGVQQLAALNCTQAEIAAFFGVSRSTVEHRFNEEPELREAWERGQALGCLSLRRKQSELAQSGNVTMLIWLGKQLLGQKDKTESDALPTAASPVAAAIIIQTIMQELADAPIEIRNRLGRRLMALSAPTD